MRTLGKTGIKVTELAFGALPMGPLQKNLPLPEATDVVKHALEKGINFIDTAQNYRTYAPIAEAIKRTGITPVIATKSAAATYEAMEEAVQEALDQLGVEFIDIFHLHAARVSATVFTERAGALACLKDYKTKGIIKAVGIATHSVAAARAAAGRDDIDVVFPLLNLKGRGILDGAREEMMEAIRLNYEAGKGVYIMKALAGGHLINEYQQGINFIRDFGYYHALAVGMVSTEEVDYNIAYFRGDLDPGIMPPRSGEKRAIVVAPLCRGCGTCREVCHSGAISISAGKAQIKQEKCLMCGYCTSACPEFAIRII